ncbi:MAG: TonB-linked outer membrane protein [Segetibacter sp.]|nr:TonB-linked outer membrane protein [Segetibacter sp.]
MEMKSIPFLSASTVCRKTLLLFFTLIQLAFFNQVLAQTRRVTGTVNEVSGTGIPGVTVSVKGSAVGTSTDTAGRYSIQVAGNNAVLVFSFVGYISKEETVGNRTNLSTTLSNSTSNLEEVIVVGYGTQRKSDITGAITSISAKQIEERQAVNLADALQGQAAGLLVINDAGEPGAEGSITIRGGSTFSSAGNSPLFVIDGVVGANSGGLNPNDIQSIDVLKDAASSAIYGSRAANGVIIITTKRGVEGKPRIEFRYLRKWGTMAHKLRQANSTEVRLFRNLQSGNLTGSAGGSTDSLNPGFNADNDYQDVITQTAIQDQYDFSISGGSKNISYYNSIRYIDDKGLIVNSWNKQIQVRTNIDYNPTNRMRFSTRLQFGYRNRNDINEGNTINQTFQRPTNFTLYYPDGSLTGLFSGRRNPLTVALYEVNEDTRYDGQLFNEMQYTLAKSLKFTTNFAFNFRETHEVSFQPKILSSAVPTSNSGSEGFSRGTEWQYQAYLNYDKTFLKNHKINGTLGFSAEKGQSNGTNTSARNYANETIITVNSAQTILPASFSASGNSLASVFGRAGYSFKNKYTVNGTFRYDGSSRFGKENTWGVFPSVGVAWNLSNEEFMNWSKGFLSNARVRASYGKVGNERIGNYDAIQRYNFGSYYYNGLSGVAFGSSFGNPALSWESLVQTNIGVDLAFLKGRINVTADYFIKTTEDLLYNRPLPRETGFNSVRVNLGSIQTKGLEFQVNAVPITKKDFEWSVVANFTKYTGRVKSLYNGEAFQTGNTSDGGNAGWLIREGGRLGDFYGWKAKGVYAYDQSNAYTNDWVQLTPVFDPNGAFTGYTLNGKPYSGAVNSLYGKGAKLRGGDVIFENVNKDSVIDDRDRMVIGNAQPDFYAAIINTFRYKQFSLSFTFNTMWGHEIYNNAAQTLDNYATSHIIPRPATIYNAWRKQGDVTNVPEVQRKNNTGNFRMNTSFLENGSFLRLSYARLTYALKSQVAKKVFTKGINGYVYGSNLLTWTNYSWFDPEFSSSDPLQSGQDNGRYPRRREVGLGINVNF